jgi:hypothetical protein
VGFRKGRRRTPGHVVGSARAGGELNELVRSGKRSGAGDVTVRAVALCNVQGNPSRSALPVSYSARMSAAHAELPDQPHHDSLSNCDLPSIDGPGFGASSTGRHAGLWTGARDRGMVCSGTGGWAGTRTDCAGAAAVDEVQSLGRGPGHVRVTTEARRRANGFAHDCVVGHVKLKAGQHDRHR